MRFLLRALSLLGDPCSPGMWDLVSLSPVVCDGFGSFSLSAKVKMNNTGNEGLSSDLVVYYILSIYGIYRLTKHAS